MPEESNRYESKIAAYKGSAALGTSVDLGAGLWSEVPANAVKIAFAENGRPSGWKLQKQ